MLYARHLFANAKAWEHTRLIAYTLYTVNSTKKTSIGDYMTLLTDTPERVEVLTTDEQLKLQDLAQSRLALLNRK